MGGVGTSLSHSRNARKISTSRMPSSQVLRVLHVFTLPVVTSVLLHIWSIARTSSIMNASKLASDIIVVSASLMYLWRGSRAAHCFLDRPLDRGVHF